MHSSVLVFAKILAQQGEKWFSSRAVDPCAQNPSTAVCRNRFLLQIKSVKLRNSMM